MIKPEAPRNPNEQKKNTHKNGDKKPREKHRVSYTSSGWWLTYPSEKYEFISWDDDIPIYGKKCSKPPTSN